jgi:hypothetical protein
MTKITGSIKEFKSMFDMIMCGSKNPLFRNVILEIEEETIIVNAIDTTRSVLTTQKYTGFNIEGSNNIPIDTVSISEAIRLFNDNDSLMFEYDENRIVLTVDLNGEKDVMSIPAPDINDINNKIPITFTEDSVIANEKVTIFEAFVNVDIKHIQKQIKMGNYVDPLYHEYVININENALTLSVGNINNYELSSSSKIEVEGTGVSQSQYMHGYDDVFKTLTGEVTIRINENKPMMISQIRDNYVVNFLIAPVVSGN